MNYIDIIILTVLLAGSVVGASKGIFRQLGSLGGFLIGIIGARLFAAEFSLWLRSVVDLSATTAEIASYVLVFLIVYLSVFALARLLQRITQGVALGWIDRLIGGVFGAAKYILLLSVLANLLALVDTDGVLLKRKDTRESKFYAWTLDFAPMLLDMATKSIGDVSLPTTKAADDLFFIHSHDGDALSGSVSQEA